MPSYMQRMVSGGRRRSCNSGPLVPPTPEVAVQLQAHPPEPVPDLLREVRRRAAGAGRVGRQGLESGDANIRGDPSSRNSPFRVARSFGRPSSAREIGLLSRDELIRRGVDPDCFQQTGIPRGLRRLWVAGIAVRSPHACGPGSAGGQRDIDRQDASLVPPPPHTLITSLVLPRFAEGISSRPRASKASPATSCTRRRCARSHHAL